MPAGTWDQLKGVEVGFLLYPKKITDFEFTYFHKQSCYEASEQCILKVEHSSRMFDSLTALCNFLSNLRTVTESGVGIGIVVGFDIS